jgi:hypothetical protein
MPEQELLAGQDWLGNRTRSLFVRSGMNRRRLLALAAVAPLSLLAAACGNRTSVSTDGTSTSTTTEAPTTAPGITHPSGPDDVVISLAYDGGFVAPGTIFARLPRVLITGDGSVYFEGAQTAIYPQPLLPPIFVARISEGELQALLLSAESGGLFRAVTYGPPAIGIADAPNTILVINANGATYTHDAYALGMAGDELNEDRRNFLEYVSLLEPIANGVPDSQPFAASRFAFRATPADQVLDDGVAPSEATWPATAGVRLADALECGVVESSALGTLFSESKQNTRFVENGVKYVLIVRPMLPGDLGCAAR